MWKAITCSASAETSHLASLVSLKLDLDMDRDVADWLVRCPNLEKTQHLWTKGRTAIIGSPSSIQSR